ncbi:uncharacterized protein LOC110725975 [Chenopodium quinoa]|uniref:uncharacterized protein LOC110725975 n=1 Tax=Chenopodium quinoa TaxID=63459 RepID=UPI000B790B86|nr:uncharacterized protein LOC110725975 [Chenopodium quinoa]
MVFNALGHNEDQGHLEEEEEEPIEQAEHFLYVLKASKQPLYEGISLYVLEMAARITSLKCEYNLAHRCVDGFSSLVNEAISNNNHMADTFYEVKKIVKGLELPHKKIHACSKGCMLFWKDDVQLSTCRVCGSDQYKKTSKDNVIIEDNINEDAEERDEDAAIIDYDKYDKDENISRCLVGYTVLDYNDGFFLYKAHSRSIGFSVRKSTKRRDTNDKLYEFYFRCSKEGHTKGKIKIVGEQHSVEIPILGKNDERKRKEREVNETSTGCKTHIRFKKNIEGRFDVLTHELEHNHELVITVRRHHLRSERQISAPMVELIESMIESGIKPMDAYNYIR